MHPFEKLDTRPGSVTPGGARPPGAVDGATPALADVRWKRALKGVVAAAFRLHHYRFVRTRMLHDALSASRDGSRAQDPFTIGRPENRRENLPENLPENFG